jgi:hypothetical protein
MAAAVARRTAQPLVTDLFVAVMDFLLMLMFQPLDGRSSPSAIFSVGRECIVFEKNTSIAETQSLTLFRGTAADRLPMPQHGSILKLRIIKGRSCRTRESPIDGMSNWRRKY